MPRLREFFLTSYLKASSSLFVMSSLHLVASSRWTTTSSAAALCSHSFSTHSDILSLFLVRLYGTFASSMIITCLCVNKYFYSLSCVNECLIFHHVPQNFEYNMPSNIICTPTLDFCHSVKNL